MANKEQKKSHKSRTAVEKFAEASEIKRRGFKNKVEACGFQKEIDDMIVNKKWSPQVISNELVKNHPDVNKKQLPSWKSIENYRNKYFDNISVNKFPSAIKEGMKKICKEYDSYKELVNMAEKMQERTDLGKDMEKKTGMPLKNRTIIIRDAYKAILEILDKEIEMGLRPKALINFMDDISKSGGVLDTTSNEDEDYGELIKKFEVKLTQYKRHIKKGNFQDEREEAKEAVIEPEDEDRKEETTK